MSNGNENRDYTDFYAVYNGELFNDSRYTWIQPREKQPDSQERWKRSTYNNWTKKALTIYLGYALHNKKISDPSDEVSVFDITRNSLEDSLVGGLCFILTTAAGPRVYSLKEVTPSFTGTGRTNLEISAISITANDGGELKFDFLAGEKNSITGKPVGEVTLADGSTRPIIEGEIIEVSWNKEKKSLLYDVVNLALQIFNLESIYDYALFKLGFGFEYGPAFNEDKQPPLGAYIQVPDGFTAPGFIVNGSMEAVKAISEALTKKRFEFGLQLGVEAEFSEELKFESGISKAFSLIDTNAIVSALATSVQVSVNKAFEYWGQLRGIKPPQIMLETMLRPDATQADLEELAFVDKHVNEVAVSQEIKKQMILAKLGQIPFGDLDKLIKIAESSTSKPFEQPGLFGLQDNMGNGGTQPDEEQNENTPKDESE